MKSQIQTVKTKCIKLGGLPLALGLVAIAPLGFAQDNCIQDVWQGHGNSQNLTCSAGDVVITSAANLCVHKDPDDPSFRGGEGAGGEGCQEVEPFTCNQGSLFYLTADVEMTLTAQRRTEIGFYIAKTDDGAISGECNAQGFQDTDGAYLSPDDRQGSSDLCGDIDNANNPQYIPSVLQLTCNDTGDGVVVDWCTTWRQPGADELCTDAIYGDDGDTVADFEIYPGSPSKCACGSGNIDVFSEVAAIEIDKTASPTTIPESGGDVTFTLVIDNQAAVADVTIDTLVDYKDIDLTDPAAGNLLVGVNACVNDGVPDAVNELENCGDYAILANTCDDSLPIVITPDVDFMCTFVVRLPAGDVPNTVPDWVEACGTDSFGNADRCDDNDAVVAYTDVLLTPSLVKTAVAAGQKRVLATYTVVISNPDNGAGDSLTVNTILDDLYGDLRDDTNALLVTNTCDEDLTITIVAGGTYNCMFSAYAEATGTGPDDVEDTVSATATDSDGVTYPPVDGQLEDTAKVRIDVTLEPGL